MIQVMDRFEEEKKTMAARYHSLVAAPDSLPECLKVISRDERGEIMAVRHKTMPIYGVQFHPELKSKPFAPHPLFVAFVKAAIDNSRLL